MAQLVNLIKRSIFDCETVNFNLNRIVDYLGTRSAAALYKRLDKIEDCLGDWAITLEASRRTTATISQMKI